MHNGSCLTVLGQMRSPSVTYGLFGYMMDRLFPISLTPRSTLPFEAPISNDLLLVPRRNSR